MFTFPRSLEASALGGGREGRRPGERESARGPPRPAACTLIELSIKRAGGSYYCANAQCQHVYRQGLQASRKLLAGADSSLSLTADRDRR